MITDETNEQIALTTATDLMVLQFENLMGRLVATGADPDLVVAAAISAGVRNLVDDHGPAYVVALLQRTATRIGKLVPTPEAGNLATRPTMGRA